MKLTMLASCFLGSLGFHATAVNSDGASSPLTYADIVPVCKGSVAYSLPVVSGLYFHGLSLSNQQKNRKSPNHIFWQSGDPPLIVDSFFFNSFATKPADEPPLLDVILGRESKYSVLQLSFGSALAADIESLRKGWEKGIYPTDRPGFFRHSNSPSGSSYTSEILTLFDRPFRVRCRKGLPVYSTDESTYSCRISGQSFDGRVVSFQFHTGSDLAGHWSSFDEANEAWDEPLREVEKVIISLKSDISKGHKCN